MRVHARGMHLGRRATRPAWEVERECRCGCGTIFLPRRSFHRYVADPQTGRSHRFAAKSRPVRISPALAERIAAVAAELTDIAQKIVVPAGSGTILDEAMGA